MDGNELLIGNEYIKKVIPLIDKAKHSIHICMFIWRWYEKDPFCDISLLNASFVNAVRRGVKVYSLTDSGSLVEKLNGLGIKAKKFQSSDVLHTKAVIIDSEIAVIGSHNFSNSAMFSNVETSTINRNPEMSKKLENYIMSLYNI